MAEVHSIKLIMRTQDERTVKLVKITANSSYDSLLDAISRLTDTGRGLIHSATPRRPCHQGLEVGFRQHNLTKSYFDFYVILQGKTAFYNLSPRHRPQKPDMDLRSSADSLWTSYEMGKVDVKHLADVERIILEWETDGKEDMVRAQFARDVVVALERKIGGLKGYEQVLRCVRSAQA
ncbi:beta-lactamase-like protein [Pseudohyphozyma bogoriensis]|nr:beta-lactamase-like protein [Pseudohyphozyma bogoriensis]